MTADPKEHAQNRRAARGKSGTKPDPDNNLGRGAPADREERIQQKARPIERDPQHRQRAAHDLDTEDTELRRDGADGGKPGARLGKEGAERTKR